MTTRSLHTLVLAVAALIVPLPGVADVVLDWNDIALARIAEARQMPPDAARTMAMTHVAMFDAINAIERRYTPYAFKGRAPEGASPETAAVAAASVVLLAVFPEQRATIQSAYSASLAQISDGTARSSGIALGEQVAAEIVALRSNDGAAAPSIYKPRTAPGVYVPTTLPAASEWPKVKPWFLDAAAQFRPAPPPSLASAEWARDYNEIKEIGAKNSATRTAEQTDVGRFWTITGPASWNPVVRSLASSRPRSLLENAKLFALVNLAATDALIAVFDAKYAYHLWRPITAIRNGDADGNDATQPDAGWLPLIDTPMHPEYPCAHCITSAAVCTVLESQFGTGEIPPIAMTSPAAPGVTRRWTRIRDYVKEVNDARVWSGVHYRNSTQVGEAMGNGVGSLALKKLFVPTR